MPAPKVFISYSHDSLEHREWVLRLASDLVRNGVETTLDQWDLSLGQDTVAFMERGVVEADRVLLVCTEAYVDRAEARSGGVGYEGQIVTGELVRNIETRKFIPLIRANPDCRTPAWLGSRLYVDFSDDAAYESKLEELLRELHGQPASERPSLGTSPFSGEAVAAGRASRAGPTGITPSGTSLLNDAWFEARAAEAKSGIESLGLSGAMELRFALHDPVGKSQSELLSSVSAAEIRTFGWPIGVVLPNREEYRPKPMSDGIRAEIAVRERALSGDKTYDYWAAGNSGDFYLLQSLFEDTRQENKVFFNTRIVRVTESLMFCSRFYGGLGVPPEALVSIRVSHLGLAGRELTSTGSRSIFEATTTESESHSEFVAHLGSLTEELTTYVTRALTPMFILFDFTEFDDDVYANIVTRFVNGEVS